MPYLDALAKKDVHIILKKWNRRVKYSQRRLDSKLERVNDRLRELQKENIASSKLDPLEDRVELLFDDISGIVKPTGASKVLHILLPDFLIMWDGPIREFYGCEGTGQGYVRFLKKMQNELKEVIDTYKKDREGSDWHTIEELYHRVFSDGAIRLTRMLDAYNFSFRSDS